MSAYFFGRNWTLSPWRCHAVLIELHKTSIRFYSRVLNELSVLKKKKYFSVIARLATGEKKKKKKVVKVKRKNKITTEEVPAGYSHQPVDLSATFGEP